jgi:hypothetical protein
VLLDYGVAVIGNGIIAMFAGDDQTMPIKLYEGDPNKLSGRILASWFLFNPWGPTAFSVGYADMPGTMRCPFYGWRHFAEEEIYLADHQLQQKVLASGNDFSSMLQAMMDELDRLAAKGSKQGMFPAVPHLVRTNGNPDVAAALRRAMMRASVIREADWEHEMYLLDTYGSDLFSRASEEIVEADEASDPQPQDTGSRSLLKTMWTAISRFGPGRHKSKPFSEALFARWWETVTDSRFVQDATRQFAEAWVGATRLQQSAGVWRPGYTSYSELARFYENLHMPLLPPELDEQALRSALGFSPEASTPPPHETAASEPAEEPAGEWHPMIETDPDRFWKLVHTDDHEKRVTGAPRFAELLLCEIVRYGVFQDLRIVEDLRQFYPFLIENGLPEKERERIYAITQALLLQGKIAPSTLLVFVTQETSRKLVSAAVSDYLNLAPAIGGDPMARPREIVQMVERASTRNRGAVFGALLHLGDRRVCDLILHLRDTLSTEEVQEAVNCCSTSLSAAAIEFELSWLEEGNLDEATFGLVASGLVLQRRAAEAPEVVTGEQSFPVWSVKPEEGLAMQRRISIGEYVERIKPRLYALEKSEPPPKIMSKVIAEWGLAPAGE